MHKIIALDLEGTGLLKNDNCDYNLQPGIVEFGVCSYSEKEMQIDEGCWLIDPECYFEKDAQKITGIEESELFGKPKFPDVFLEITNMFVGCDTLITFNGIGYDIKLLQYTLQKYNLETRFPWPPKQIDLMFVGRDVLGLQGKTGNKFPNLMEMYEALFSKKFENQHRASSDAKATLDCALKFIEDGYIIL